ncbi:hypothetical protein F511_40810 [Dorcoceras hygrometricum]|uniref:Uncharacterized protein n=1 Tax=Dorcoceras hygrometricum TaxID=472368 RepID=A0A2Z7DAB0_9LAMI|nr:hypothetical protein F511_40810 [Dorcoceras hygrometricum]
METSKAEPADRNQAKAKLDQHDVKIRKVTSAARESCSLDRFGGSSTGIMRKYASWFRCEEKMDSDVIQIRRRQREVWFNCEREVWISWNAKEEYESSMKRYLMRIIDLDSDVLRRLIQMSGGIWIKCEEKSDTKRDLDSDVKRSLFSYEEKTISDVNQI